MTAAPGRRPGARAAAMAAMFGCWLGASPVGAQQDPPPPPTAAQPDLPPNNDVNDGTENTDVGLLQIELGSQFTRVDEDSRAAGVPFTARYGVVEWLELSLGGDLLVEQSDSGGGAHGFGDLQVGGRIRLFGARGGLPTLSVLPLLIVPTANAAAELGTGRVGAAIAVLTGRDFSHASHVDVSYGMAAIGEGGGNRRITQHAASVSGSIGVTQAWSPALTFAWVSRQDADTGEAFLLSADSVVTLSRRVALDLSVQFGLNADAPRLGIGGGVSFVIGELDVDQGVHARRHRLRFRPRHPGTARPPTHH